MEQNKDQRHDGAELKRHKHDPRLYRQIGIYLSAPRVGTGAAILSEPVSAAGDGSSRAVSRSDVRPLASDTASTALSVVISIQRDARGRSASARTLA